MVQRLAGDDVMGERDEWQVEGDAAERFQRYIVPLITKLWAEDLVERIAPVQGERLLDVACGTGVVARLAAARMAGGTVVGLDLNPAMLAVAKRLSAAGEGSTID